MVKLKQVITDHIISSYSLDPEHECVIEYIDADELLCPERLDLISKIKYIDNKVNNLGLNFVNELYAAHIEAFTLGLFTEPGTESKNTLQKYVSDFDELITNIRQNGYDPQISVIPVSRGNVLLDGAHRSSIGIYYKMKVPVVKLDVPPVNYGSGFFLERLLDVQKVEYLVNEYCKIKNHVYVAFVWPRANPDKNKAEIEKMISLHCKIIYKKEIILNLNGLHLLMTELYSGHEWLGNIDNEFSGAFQKASDCYASCEKVNVYFIECIDFNEILQLKNKVRAIVNVDKHSIHITDNKEETIRAADLILNDNSIHFLNHGKPFTFKSFFKQIESFSKRLDEYRLPKEDFLIDSSSTLSLYGLRMARDIDFITMRKDFSTIEDDNVNNHHQYLNFHKETAPELIYNPKNFLFFFGLKFISLDNLMEFKKNRKTEKDAIDLVLLRGLNESSPIKSVLNKLHFTIKRNIRNIKYRIRRTLITLLKKMGLFESIRNIYRILKNKRD